MIDICKRNDATLGDGRVNPNNHLSVASTRHITRDHRDRAVGRRGTVVDNSHHRVQTQKDGTVHLADEEVKI